LCTSPPIYQDMLWRLRPDLFIELGTSGGGSAAFWMHVMEQYNPNAKVLTMDPSIKGAGSQKSTPLQPWNYGAVKRFCPHCIPANESKVSSGGYGCILKGREQASVKRYHSNMYSSQKIKERNTACLSSTSPFLSPLSSVRPGSGATFNS